MEKFALSRGRRIIGWDEILEGGLAPEATVQSWRGMAGAVAAAKAGHDVISSPTSHCYLDYAQDRHPSEPTWMGYVDLKKSYSFEPVPAELTPAQAKHVLGLEGNMWTEHAPQPRVDWQVFPRLCALAEVAWTPQDKRDWEAFEKRMAGHYRRLDALGVTYHIPLPHCASENLVFSETAEVALQNAFPFGRVHFTLDGTEPTADSPVYENPVALRESIEVKARTILSSGRGSEAAVLSFRKMAMRPARRLMSPVGGLQYAYYEGAWRRLPEFDSLTPALTSIVGHCTLGMQKRDEQFGLRFTGFLRVPRDGVYTFYLTSDDGSRLRIDGETIVDHDGPHAASERRGEVILQRGYHEIVVEYFQAGGALRLDLDWAGPELPRQAVPPQVLVHAAGS